MLTRAELKEISKTQLKGNWGVAILAVIIISVVMPILGFIPYAGAVEQIILAGPLTLGLVIVFLKITKEEKPIACNIFDGFNRFGVSFLLYILVLIFTFLWTLLLIVPGIIKSISYSMSYFILADNPNMTAKEALNESKKITMGHKMDIFVLYLSFIWWYLLVLITGGLAGLYVFPYFYATLTNYYYQIKSQPVIVNDTQEE
jgi:uncharacterized membrane protein